MSYGVNVTGPTYVFTPLSAQTSQLSVQNIGSNPVYLGSYNQLSTVNPGLPLFPGHPTVLRFSPSSQPTVYASAGFNAGTAAATLGTGGAATVGTTKLTVTTMSTVFTANSVLQLGAGTNTEYVVVASTASTVVTLSNPTQFYHLAGDVMTAATSVFGQLSVSPGVL